MRALVICAPAVVPFSSLSMPLVPPQRQPVGTDNQKPEVSATASAAVAFDVRVHPGSVLAAEEKLLAVPRPLKMDNVFKMDNVLKGLKRTNESQDRLDRSIHSIDSIIQRSGHALRALPPLADVDLGALEWGEIGFRDINECQVARVPSLHYVPRTGFVGSYGGGDGMLAARQLLMVSRPPNLLGTVLKGLKRTIIRHTRALAPPAEVDLGALEWGLNLHISSRVYGADSFNMMYQGWLFGDCDSDKPESSTQRYPLVGLFEAHNVTSGDAAAHIGMECLKEADQHIHTVDCDEAGWRFGSDMARFSVDHDAMFAKAWAVCVDVETGRAEVALLVIVHPDAEDAVECTLPSALSRPGEFVSSFCDTVKDTKGLLKKDLCQLLEVEA